MPNLDLLDRPIWSSLTSGWAPLAEGTDRALRLARDYGPFGASANGIASDLDALGRLIPDDGELWFVERGGAAVPPDAEVVRTAVLTQMVAETLRPKRRDIGLIELGDADGAEMQALAKLTKPGPFARLTHRLGGFVGVREQRRLIAMAGERMRMPGLCEVSGVCTHPDHRGRGLAGALMSIVAERIIARGETPFLHSYAHNEGAIALYESLGFRIRTNVELTIVTRRKGF
jgi:predicted GNAT family acetyltransferase